MEKKLLLERLDKRRIYGKRYKDTRALDIKSKKLVYLKITDGKVSDNSEFKALLAQF
ncbi:MAG: hypothetical protein QXP91_12790 [Candidatus Methanomethylicia archaeon]